jgi:hyaluronate lyase
LLSDTYDDPTPTRTIPVLLTATQLRDDDTIKRRGRLVGSWVFHNQDRIVHRRPEWALGISMYSNRIANYESINGENLRGWLTADGATYLYLRVSDQYQEDFWATVDHARIPGTTVDVRQRTASEGWYHRSPNSWVGGACLDGRYTAAGMHLSAQGASLTARKSWFCFDDEYVALGAGVTATDGRAVETVVENRRVRGTEQLTVNGEPVRWLHLQGTGGYVFPTPTSLTVDRESRTGAWSDVTNHPNWSRTDPITREYVTAVIPHGVDPADASYAYVVLPNASPAQTAAYAARPKIRVLANTTEAQVVAHPGAGVVMANLWQAASTPTVSSDTPVSAVLKKRSGQLRLAIACPSRPSAPATVRLDVKATKVVAADDGIEVKSTDPLTFTADFADDPGATKTLTVAV